MSKLFVLTILLASSISFGQTPKVDLGSKVNVLTDDHVHIGGQYTNEILSITFSINGYDIYHDDYVSQVALRFVNKTTGEILTNWEVASTYPSVQIPRAYQAFSPNLDKQQATKILRVLKSAVIQIQVSNASQTVFTGYIDIAGYCATIPTHFLNLDTGDMGCPGN